MTEYKVRDSQDIFAIAVEVYGDSSYAFKLAQDNDILINDLLTGLVLDYDETVKQSILSPLVVARELENNLQQTYIPNDNQSIFDIMLMTVGGFDGIVEAIQNSTIAGINSTITIKDRFLYIDSKNSVKTYLSKTNRVFATLPSDSDIGREHDDSFRRVQYT